MEWWIILLIVIGAVICLTFALSLLIYKVGFGSRCDRNPILKYFAAPDFGLSFKKVTVKCGKTTLNGGIYRGQSPEKEGELIIFQHGLGAGQAAYTTEIAYFCSFGYPVLALDIKGCDLSEGKTINGVYEGVKCVKAAVDFARADERFKDSKIYLIGHSWGGYSVACAAAERSVDKVVAISAPDSPARTLYEGSAKFVSRPVAALLYPFWQLINLCKFGARGNARASKALKKSGAPALLIHGDKDDIVNINASAYGRAEGGNIEKLLAEGKSHNPYATPKAQSLLIELNKKLTASNRVVPPAEKKAYCAAFDFKAACEEDLSVMGEIAKFLARK